MINPGLASGLARLGHTQLVCIADFGLPLPAGANIVDLSLVRGIPTFNQVLDAVLAEIEVEGAVSASESQGTVVDTWLRERNLEPEYVPHEEFKALLDRAQLIIRTGEATAYANVILRCGVPF